MAETEQQHVATRRLILGIGCQRGVSVELLARGVDDALQSAGLAIERVRMIATAGIKRDEAGLLELARAHGWELVFHDDLGEGVAEPAALRHGALLMGKRIYREANLSMTVAIAELP